MYKIRGSGPVPGPMPKENTPCDVTYTGQFTDGRQFDSGTTNFAPNQVIRGWTEAMLMMHQGDHWELYAPSFLAYGKEGAAGGLIPPNADLVFQLTLNVVLETSDSAV